MIKVTIGNKLVGEDEPCLISFEPGATFTQIDDAKQMIKATASAGADAIKFQTFLLGDSDRMMAKKDILVNFTTPTGKKQELVYEALKRRELSKEEWVFGSKCSNARGNSLFAITRTYVCQVYWLYHISEDYELLSLYGRLQGSRSRSP